MNRLKHAKNDVSKLISKYQQNPSYPTNKETSIPATSNGTEKEILECGRLILPIHSVVITGRKGRSTSTGSGRSLEPQQGALRRWTRGCVSPFV